MQLRLPRSQLTVDELTVHIQDLFLSDSTLKSVIVSGEISEFKRHSSGHCYFTLLGEESRVACAFFKQYAGYVPKWPDNGDGVLVEGSIGLYPQRGVYQLYVRRLIPVGTGAIERARQELKERLEKEGLFSPALKRVLPKWPSKVALITSKTGAAVWDVLKIAERRFPCCSVLLFPAQVQGIDAPMDIVEAFERVSAVPGLDCVLLVRGGGGREDLVPFDDERVVRAVRSCPVPVVTGVGHDVDITLADMAADVRASTPSAAAELVFPDGEELRIFMERMLNRMENVLKRQIAFEKQHLLESKEAMSSTLSYLFSAMHQLILARNNRLIAAMSLIVAQARENCSVRAASLEALSPLKVMARGFVACEQDKKPLRSVKKLIPGDEICLYMQDGKVWVTVNKVIPF